MLYRRNLLILPINLFMFTFCCTPFFDLHPNGVFLNSLMTISLMANYSFFIFFFFDRKMQLIIFLLHILYSFTVLKIYLIFFFIFVQKKAL